MIKSIKDRKLEHLRMMVDESGRVAMPVEVLTEEELRRLMEASPIVEESKALDHLVPEDWCCPAFDSAAEKASL